jgi:hypothetical protein
LSRAGSRPEVRPEAQASVSSTAAKFDWNTTMYARWISSAEAAPAPFL